MKSVSTAESSPPNESQTINMPKRSNPIPESTWYCVMDRNCRLLYLGTDESAAKEFAVPGTTLRSAQRMGDAMNATAKAVGQAWSGKH